MRSNCCAIAFQLLQKQTILVAIDAQAGERGDDEGEESGNLDAAGHQRVHAQIVKKTQKRKQIDTKTQCRKQIVATVSCCKRGRVKWIDAQCYERVADGAEADGDADEIAAKQGVLKGEAVLMLGVGGGT